VGRANVGLDLENTRDQLERTIFERIRAERRRLARTWRRFEPDSCFAIRSQEYWKAPPHRFYDLWD
jgi:hypothetical protein